MDDRAKKTKRLAIFRAILLIILILMLAATTYALVNLAQAEKVEENLFQMAKVEIDVNDDELVFDKDTWIEPGTPLEREMTVTNSSSEDVAVYYRLYLSDLEGGLEDVIEFTIYHGDKLLYQGKASELTLENPCVDDEALPSGETRTLTFYALLPEEADGSYQGGYLEFDIQVDAVQERNNPDIEFE